MSEKYNKMFQFWTERANQYGADPKSNTNDVWLREVEIASIQKILDCYQPNCVLDFGCANGYTTRRLAEKYPDISFVGIDINPNMIAAANGTPLPDNLSFRCGNVLVDDIQEVFDLIISIRVFQNIESHELQTKVFDRLYDMLALGGLFFYIESYADGYEQINKDRAELEISPLPIHSHLTLLTEAFDKHVAKALECVETGSPSSSYYLITRLVYSKLANLNGDEINYDHPLHKLGAIVPQIGEYGPQKSRLYRKGTNNVSFFPKLKDKLTIDFISGIVTVDTDSGFLELPLADPKAFSAISRAWLRSGWDTKYVYSFTWLGRPIIQLPEDMLRIQEVIYQVQPDILIETGIAHGGSLIYYASLFNVIGKGRVIGVDIEIRPHNRQAIEVHEMYNRITMIEGSSIDKTIIGKVHAQIKDGERGLVILDSNHTKAHVLSELRAYAEFVAVGSYIVACDGIMQEVVGAPRTNPEWVTDNPQSAVKEFLAERDDFVLEEPMIPFNEGLITERVTYWPNAFLRRIK